MILTFLLTFPDMANSDDEERHISIGLSDTDRILVLIHTDRQGRIRIISCRTATTRERRFFMKKAETKKLALGDEMRPEYDFSAMKGGVRGKYYKAYRKGHKVVVHKEDGKDSVRYFKPEKGAVVLEPDVRKYFPTSDAVNKALRLLIELIPAKRPASGRRE